MSDSNHPKSVIFPWADTNKLASSLQAGELCLATALGQFGAVVRDGLKIIETYAGEQMKLNLDRKIKLDKMDKLVKDLTEKCQCMQQALMYKEEKYDEKCREVERYKVICELSAKSAVNDELYYANMDENISDPNNNFISTTKQEPLEPYLERDDAVSMTSRGTGKKIKIHTKISTSQAQSAYSMPAPNIDRQSQPDNDPDDTSYQVRRDEVASMAAHYAGGPTRRPRKQTSAESAAERVRDSQLRQRLSIIGGVNVSHSSGLGPVPVNNSFRRDNFDIDDRHRSSKIALVGQRNEVISSSRNAAHVMRQKLTEKDLHKQVAEGSWNRMASRRKKEWPF